MTPEQIASLVGAAGFLCGALGWYFVVASLRIIFVLFGWAEK